MCLAIYKPATTKPDWEAYREGFSGNPHGWGFATIDNGELLDAVGIGNFDEFRRNFEPFAHCESIIHFRWATHGTKGTENCHPFTHDGLAMIHNGIIDIDTKDDESRSDTFHFFTKVVMPMYERDRDFFLRDDIIYTMEMAHSGSKFCFLRADGQSAIWNKSRGVDEYDGHWFSNYGYLPTRYSRSRLIGYDSAIKTGADLFSHSDSCKAAEPIKVTEPSKVNDRISLDDDPFLLKDEDETKDDDMMDGVSDLIREDEDADAYCSKLERDLYNWGLSKPCIEEVRELFGWSGLESLWDQR